MHVLHQVLLRFGAQLMVVLMKLASICLRRLVKSRVYLKLISPIGTVENIPKYIAMAKDKTKPYRLMGFGHRVYKNFDPRAKIMQKICHDVRLI